MFVLLIILSALSECSLGEGSFYRAAVVHYEPIYGESPRETVFRNAIEYGRLINKAKVKKAQIVIFPEYGLSTLSAFENPLIYYSSAVPDPIDRVIPCETPNGYKNFFVKIACAVKRNKIYTVINLIEKNINDANATIFYNTNVVFNEKGAVIARFRKINLSEEHRMVPGNEIVTFKTNFGVTFGMFICFDLYYRTPAVDVAGKANDIIFTASWYSETPFLTGVSQAAGYARANKVNLLCSCYGFEYGAYGGSGIFLANGSSTIQIPDSGETRLIIQDITKHNSKINVKVAPKKKPDYVIATTTTNPLRENLKNFTFIKLDNRTHSNNRLCYGESCCTFKIDLEEKKLSEIVYMLTIFDGILTLGTTNAHCRICSIVSCVSSTTESCGLFSTKSNNILLKSIEIEGEFPFVETDYYYPVTLKANKKPVPDTDFEYSITSDNTTRVIMKTVVPQKNLLSFGIYGRADPPMSERVFWKHYDDLD